MKDGAAKKSGGSAPKNRDLRPAASRRTVSSAPASAGHASQPTVAPAIAEGSVLDLVVLRGSLDEAWAAATSGPGATLRARSRMEQQLGVSLAHVQVHSGARAKSLLQRLGAHGAARGEHILVADPTDAMTLGHEVAHAVQARGGGDGSGVIAAHDQAEVEAETAALQLRAGRRVRLRRRIGQRAIALRRVRDPARGELPPLREEDLLERAPRAPEQRERPAPDELESPTESDAAAPAGEDTMAEETPATARRRAGAEAQSERAEPGQAEREELEEAEAADRAERDQAQAALEAAEAAGEEELEVGPNRRQAVDELLTDQQESWDEGADEAEDYEAEPCPRHRVGRGEQPFARGPPLEVQATEQLPELDNPEPEALDRSELLDAERDVRTQLDAAPAESSGDRGSLDPERDAERRSQSAQVRQCVDAELRQQSIERRDAPELRLEGESDIDASERAAKATIESTAENESASARGATEEDFGEERMAPHSDPTEGHDTGLAGLEVPDVDLEAEVETAARDRIVTAENAGQLPLDEAVVVRRETMDQVTAVAEERAQRKREISEGITRSEASFTRLCRDGDAERRQIETETEGEVRRRREGWRVALDDHVRTRQGEADELIRDKTEHARGVAERAESDASATLDDANQAASEQGREVERRALAKSEQSESRSWWVRGIDFVRQQIDSLVAWIDDFIDAAHRAIDRMLDAAAAVAHRIVEAGRNVVQATLALAHRGVDLIADNLPGELGDIAREHRDDIHTFLDEQQEAVDDYAAALHEDIDTAIAQVREDLHQGLEDFRAGVHEVADDLNAALDVAENGLMALLRQLFPGVAAFLENGIFGPIREAGAQLRDWAQTALDGSGLGDLQAMLEGLHQSRFCQGQSQEDQEVDCEAFKQRLEGIQADFEALLASPVAQQIQGFLQASRDDAAQQQVDAISGFFSFIRMVAEPVYDWWQSVEPQINEALAWLGDVASDAWAHIARLFGFDLSLPPLEAIKQALEDAWDAIASAAEPLITGLREAYRWVVEDSPLASLIEFFASIPEAISALGQLIGEMTDEAGEWIASAAQTLRDTVMPLVNRVLGAVADGVDAVVERVVGWTDQLLAAFDALLAWEAVDELLQAVLSVVQAFATPIRAAIQLVRDCGARAFEALSHVLRNVERYARTILDVVTGVVQAIVGFPALTVAFFIGNVWLHVVPDCYKAPILNFLLDLAIRTIQFFPEPADFMLAALYQGLLSFLQGLREAHDDQKVGAINLLASIMAGNAEVAAGFVVGLAEGVWGATGGTLMFLGQAAAWLVSLPFQLMRWAAGLVSGSGPGQARQAGDDTPVEAEDSEGDMHEAQEAVGGSLGRELAEADGEPRQRGPPSPESMRQAEALEARGESETEVETPEPEVEAELDEEPVDESTDVGAIERAADDAQGSDGGAESEAETAEGGEGGESGEVDPDRPPAIPEAIAGLRSTVQQLLASGFTPQDVMAALDGVRDTMRTFIGRIAREAANQLLAALNAEGAAFSIGRMIGAVVGQLVVEAVLAFFTGGASAGLGAARAALGGARAAGQLASVLRRVRSAIQPLLNAMARLRSTLGQVVGRLRSWLDDIVRWMRGVARRAQQRVSRAMRGRRGGRRGRRGNRRRGRDRDRDRESPAEKRRRLERARRAIVPRLRRALDDGMSPSLLRSQLGRWRLRYRLASLRVVGGGRRRTIRARVNPAADFLEAIFQDPDGGVVGPRGEDLIGFLRRESRRIMDLYGGAGRDLVDSNAPTRSLSEQEIEQFRRGVGSHISAEEVRDALTRQPQIPSYQVPLGTSLVELLSAVRAMPPLPAGRVAEFVFSGVQVTVMGGVSDTENRVQVPQGGTQRGDTYPRLAQRVDAGELALSDLSEFPRTHSVPSGRSAEHTGAMAVLQGQEARRTDAALAHAMIGQDLEASGRSGAQLLGEEAQPFWRRNPGGDLPMTGQRVTGEVASLDLHLDRRYEARQRGEGVGPFTARSTSQGAVAAIRREEQMLRLWISTLPDEYFDDVRSADEAVDRIKGQITARLLRSAGVA